MINTKDNTLEEFLPVAIGAKEVSLVVAKDNSELLKFVGVIKKSGFVQSENVNDLTQNLKIFFIVDKSIDKDIYDFIVQYPSGQIEIFDKNIMQSKVYSPDYANSAFIILVTEDNLNLFNINGLNLLSVLGPALRTN